MQTLMDGHIVVDTKGIPRIAGSRSRVVDVVLDTRGGLTPDRIHEEYPHLSLAQIHAALAYYYDHQAELDAAIQRGSETVDRRRAEFPEAPVVERLRAARKQP
jgi:uncharacterized protein (DUF433 family)